MENLKDYSNYVFVAYVIAISCLTGLAIFVGAKYFILKSKLKNAKNAK